MLVIAVQSGSASFAVDQTTNGTKGEISGASWNSSVALKPPTSLTVAGTDGKITLRWNSTSGANISKYRIYRATSSPAGTLTDSVTNAPPDTFYVDSNVSNGTTYYYRITSVDSDGNVSNYSDEVSATPRGLKYVATTGNNSNNGSSSSPYKTIQYAIDNTTAGDTIYVADGTYEENVNLNNKWVSIRSQKGYANCIIQATSNSNDVITASSGETKKTEVIGFTIKGGNSGVKCTNNSAPTITNCLLKENIYAILAEADAIDGNFYGNIYSNNNNSFISISGSTFGFVNDNITRTWKKDGAPYIITQDLTIKGNGSGSTYRTATLVIESGTTIKFKKDIDLYVGTTNSLDRGALQATGVTFQAFNVDGWNGIDFLSYTDDKNTFLDSCTIQDASQAVSCTSASPTIKNSTLKKNTDAIVCDPGSGPTITNNVFSETVNYPIRIYASQIDSNIFGNTYSNNPYGFVYVISGSSYKISSDSRVYDWLKDGVPYVMSDDLYIYETSTSTNNTPKLKIYPGVTIKFPKDKGIEVGSSDSRYTGTLDAKGVTFTVADTTNNARWAGIDLEAGSTNEKTVLDSNIVEYAKRGFEINGNSSPVIKNNTIRYNSDYGIYSSDNGFDMRITGNTFLENKYPVAVRTHDLDSTLYGNTYTNNTNNYIQVTSDRIADHSRTFDWVNDGVPYVLDGHLNVYESTNDQNGDAHAAVLKIYPGVTVRFPKENYLEAR
uniref:Putative fibronectin type III domain protein n=1 Tax=uncultured marine crenarchaeote HF4000_APKG2O16 TaxID=455582 RepID=B3T6W1_9ARCH|nr:putative fibronectin type III domain protein [uncultured marine crenarchaeote HF4000_APKG2O16]